MVRTKVLNGYPNYIIYDDGRVFSIKRNIFLKPILDRGYYSVNICINNTKTKYRIHRLVAEMFIPNKENKPYINHKDCNKLNNNYWNLEWVTNQENMDHAKENNLFNPLKGEESINSKLTEKQIKWANKQFHSGKTIRSLALLLNVSSSTLQSALSGKNWKHLNLENTIGDARKGTRMGYSKLTDEKIYKIAELWNSCCYSCTDIAKMFGVFKTIIVGIIARKRWKHVPIVINPETPETIAKRKFNRYNKKPKE